jgi:hypothetical protein
MLLISWDSSVECQLIHCWHATEYLLMACWVSTVDYQTKVLPNWFHLKKLSKNALQFHSCSVCEWNASIYVQTQLFIFQTLGNVWLKWWIKMWSANVNKISWKCISVFGKKANLGKSLQVCWSLPKWEKPQQSSRMNKIFNWYISKDKKQDITTEPQFKLHKLEQVAKQLHNKNKNQH